MERNYYALYKDTVYIFPRKAERNKFLQRFPKARIMYAYDRHIYRTHVKVSTADDLQIDDTTVKLSNNVSNKRVFER